MISVKDFMETVNYRITEGSEYTWHCYGDHAYSLDSWNGDNDHGHAINMVFDLNTQTVYEMTACDYDKQNAYRWINPDYRKDYQTESSQRGVAQNQAWDDVDYINLETSKDMLEKARAIVTGEEYDTRISVPIELLDHELFQIMRMAHELDITLNEYVERVLRSELGMISK